MSAYAPFDEPTDKHGGQLVTCHVSELCPHPSYKRHGITVTAAQMSALVILDPASLHRDPLHITRDRLILDGYARWQLAKQRGLQTLLCIEHDLNKEDALLLLIQQHQRLRGLNDFVRILLALDLEPMLRERARINQQNGGQQKLSSNLTKADRVDVRREIAKAAGVSVGNVSKVRYLLTRAKPELREALHAGEVSIHRAWQWLKRPEKQVDELLLYRDQRGINRTISTLLQAHQSSMKQEHFAPQRVIAALAAMPEEQRNAVTVGAVKAPGDILIISTGLLDSLMRQSELRL